MQVQPGSLSYVKPLPAFSGPARKPLVSLAAMPEIRFGNTQNKREIQIVASLGPSSTSPEVIEEMIKAGADVFRINFAVGTLEQHAKTVETVRAVVNKLKQTGQLPGPVRLMADLQGPRIAVGELPNDGRRLLKNEVVKLSANTISTDADVISTTYPDLIGALQPGNRLLIDDARMILEVVAPASASPDGLVTCKVVKGGALKSNAWINVPDVKMQTPALTEKDKADLAFALDKDFEIITESYPATDKDVLETRALIAASGKNPMLIAKIERPSSVQPEMLKAITAAADGVMVARGDLGTEMGLVNLPRLQQQIINEARGQGKSVVVANKLLGSMVASDQPSRADVFDVAETVKNGADMLMLTDETSAGKFPVDAVKWADALIKSYEPKAPAPEPAQPLHPLEELKLLVYQLVDEAFEKLAVYWDQFSRWLEEKMSRLNNGNAAE